MGHDLGRRYLPLDGLILVAACVCAATGALAGAVLFGVIGAAFGIADWVAG